jgi:ferritin
MRLYSIGTKVRLRKRSDGGRHERQFLGVGVITDYVSTGDKDMEKAQEILDKAQTDEKSKQALYSYRVSLEGIYQNAYGHMDLDVVNEIGDSEPL